MTDDAALVIRRLDWDDPNQHLAIEQIEDVYDAMLYRNVSDAIFPRIMKPFDQLPIQGYLDYNKKGRDPITPPKPETLCHYTSLDGFLGIISSQCLFFTSVMALNDGAEIIGLFHAVRQVLEARIRDEQDKSKAQFFMFLLQRVHRYGQHEPLRSYVASFTDQTDETVQWQNYGRSNGVCLEFKAEEVRYEISHYRNHYLFQVEYRSDAQRTEFIRNMSDDVARDFDDHLGSSDAPPYLSPRWIVIAHAIIGSYARLFGVVKTEDFAHEREWRLLYYRPLTPERRELESFQHRNGYLSTRYRFPLSRRRGSFLIRALKTVVVGPNPHASIHQQKSTMFSVKRALHDNGLGHVDVHLSKSNLRPILS